MVIAESQKGSDHMRTFQVEGNCNPAMHYMNHPWEDYDNCEYVDRQTQIFYDKSCQAVWEDYDVVLAFKYSKDSYLVLRLSFEAADEYFTSLYHFSMGFIMDVTDELVRNHVEESVIDEWKRPVSKTFHWKLGQKITALCTKANARWSFWLMKLDKSSDNQIFLAFLGLLRNNQYLQQDQPITSIPTKLHIRIILINQNPWFILDCRLNILVKTMDRCSR